MISGEFVEVKPACRKHTHCRTLTLGKIKSTKFAAVECILLVVQLEHNPLRLQLKAKN
jgi:hypothetical protein